VMISDRVQEHFRPMVRIDQTEETLALHAGPIVLAFRFDGQRWPHSIAIGERLVASSVEWLPERDDPRRVVSPAYQQLSRQASGEAEQVLLLGQWGHHHFSSVFTIHEDAGDVSIAVDVALRNRADLESFGATYLLPIGAACLIEAGPSAIVWAIDDSIGGRLAFETAQPVLAEAGRSGTYVQALAPFGPEKSTHRLSYRWRWLADND
jgi:hypothetical protein